MYRCSSNMKVKNREGSVSGMEKINKILVANRGEIAIRIFRACTELKLLLLEFIQQKIVDHSIVTKRMNHISLEKEKNQSMRIWISKGLLQLRKILGQMQFIQVMAFLAENAEFARRLEEEGIIFIGPTSTHLDMFGDKVKAREQAIAAGLPVIPGSDGPVSSAEEVAIFGKSNGYPIIVKASLGGGGRGMRIVNSEDEVAQAFERAKSEAKSAFGSDEMYVEKYIDKPKHIEVQILGDMHGNVVHLYERDCSIQRRHQKVVEIAPSISLGEELSKEICDAAVKLMKNIDYINAGTVEFLVSDGQFYFIEVNPRIQVEHTITEMVTGIDIVHAQIHIADGKNIHEGDAGITRAR